MNTRSKNILNVIIMLGLIISLEYPPFLAAQEIYDLPKFNISEKGVPHSKLVIIKQISSDFDKDLFFAVPKSICVGDNGVFYVLDMKLLRIFIFNSQYQCIGQCLEKGAGPGEASQGNNLDINMGRDGNLYVLDSLGDRISRFSALGKFQKDFKLNRRRISLLPFRPVVDKAGCFYVFSTNYGLVDKKDQNLKEILHTYLDVNLNRKFVVFKPAYLSYDTQSNPPRWVQPNFLSTMFDITNEGQLFIYSFRSSTVFLFKKEKLMRQFDILIDSVLINYKAKIEEMIKTGKKNTPGKANTFQSPMFQLCFLDRDEPYFYLQLNGFGAPLYQFNFSGDLIRILDFPKEKGTTRGSIQAKKNGLFYGISYSTGNPIILRPEDR